MLENPLLPLTLLRSSWRARNSVEVEELSSKFTVEPSVQQTLEIFQIQQSAAFLTLINITPVTEQSGSCWLALAAPLPEPPIFTTKEREPTDPTLMEDVEYKCEQTNFDTVLTYAKLDLWAKSTSGAYHPQRYRQTSGAGPHHDWL